MFRPNKTTNTLDAPVRIPSGSPGTSTPISYGSYRSKYLVPLACLKDRHTLPPLAVRGDGAHVFDLGGPSHYYRYYPIGFRTLSVGRTFLT